jgi:2-iminobutanoate/2-iminopropanoate deaminase
MTTPAIIHTDSAPKAIGPYSQAIRVGELLFCSGQIPLDPATMNIVEGEIETQTRRVLQNLSAVLQAAGTSLSRVVKTTVFLQDMGEFARMNTVYGEFFTDNRPARSTVQVAALPRNVKIEIEAVALVSD